MFSVIAGFSKFVWLYPTKTLTSAEVIQKLKNQQSYCGNLGRTISDRGTAITSNEFKDYCKNEGMC